MKYTVWVLKRQKNQIQNCNHSLDYRESQKFQKNIYFCFLDYTKAFECVPQQIVENS